MTHWCQNIQRDEVVRAAEDNRQGPLPTLEEAIAAVTERRPQEPGGGGNVTGLRKERVTLEVTHGESFGVSHWSWVTILRLQSGESVRVVEETHFDDLALVAMERDAAIRERDAAKADAVAKWTAMNSALCQLGDVRSERDAALARVAELEAASGGGQEPVAWGFETTDGAIVHVSIFQPEPGTATVVPLYRSPPQPRGWLTGEERELIAGITDEDAYTEDAQNIAKGLLARSTPPEVVHPDCHFDQFSGCSAVHAWNICAADFRKALAAAGVTVKEVGRE